MFKPKVKAQPEEPEITTTKTITQKSKYGRARVSVEDGEFSSVVFTANKGDSVSYLMDNSFWIYDVEALDDFAKLVEWVKQTVDQTK